MRDSIIKNTGNSRYLKSAISASATWEQFRAALIAGTLPIDLNGINTAGWQQVGDALNKANLLPDGIITAFGLPGSNPQVKDGISRLPWHKIQEWTTAGSYTWTAPDLFNGRDYTIGVMVIGGGASGAVAIANHMINLDDTTYYVPGSPSGFSICAVVKIVPGQSYPVIVGAGGAAVTNTYSGSSVSRTQGSNGGSSAFNTNLIAQGAQYDNRFNTSYSLDKGGQLQVPLGAMNTNNVMDNMFGGVPIISSGTSSQYSRFVNNMDFLSCFNPFECTRILGAGGGACFTKSGSTFTNYEGPGGKHPVTGLGATDGVARKLNSSGSASVVGLPTAPGCGGGSVFAYSYNDVTITATSGAGADGAVMIYIMGVEA
jgi:hypothetical protein